ncbi:hypothetical protein ACFO1B_48090, partial [Dactylosporangium siamense]
MRMIDDPGDALAVLHDPAFVVPPVPAATDGVAWLRSTVGRFSTGEAHTRRRALSESLLSTVDPAALREAAASSPHAHPVQLLAAALGLDSSPRTTDAVRAVAAAYQPGTGDEAAADVAVRALIDTFGGTPDEVTAARIGVLVQACDATATLIDRARATDLEAALRDTPPVLATKRMATRPADLNATRAVTDRSRGGRVGADDAAGVRVGADDAVGGRGGVDGAVGGRGGVDEVSDGRVRADDFSGGQVGVDDVVGVGDLGGARGGTDDSSGAHVEGDHTGGIRVEAGEVVRVSLRGIPFGAGPRGCPGRAHALALAEGALRGGSGAAVDAAAGDAAVGDSAVSDGAVGDGGAVDDGAAVDDAAAVGGAVSDGAVGDGGAVDDGAAVDDAAAV